TGRAETASARRRRSEARRAFANETRADRDRSRARRRRRRRWCERAPRRMRAAGWWRGDAPRGRGRRGSVWSSFSSWLLPLKVADAFEAVADVPVERSLCSLLSAAMPRLESCLTAAARSTAKWFLQRSAPQRAQASALRRVTSGRFTATN